MKINEQVGQRIKMLRKRKGMNQSELAAALDKSLRTVQKYETGEIEVSFAVVNHLAELLDSTPTYILGYETNTAPIRNLSDVLDFLFKLETVKELGFRVDVRRPPHYDQWECSITFDGKADAYYNSDLCLILEKWADEAESVRTYAHSQHRYRKWKDETLAYYSHCQLTCEEPEELDPEVRMQKRKEFLQHIFDEQEE